MIYSLNEIDAHCKKAARGVGFEWGYAEDIGKVARWLASFELPGVSLICRYLDQIETSPKSYNPPMISSQNKIQADSESLCPIQTGCYLTDVLTVNSDQEYSFERLRYPLLLLPFLSRLAVQSKLSVRYLYDDNQFHYADGKLQCDTSDKQSYDYVEHAKCIFTSLAVKGQNPRVIGQEVNSTDWKRLNDFATKTYVPATEESRRGAGPSD